LPIAAARLLERRPGTTLSVLTGPYAQFRNALRDGEVALFVGTVSDEPPAQPVVREALFTDHDYIVARNDHPLAARRTVTLEDLRKYPWIFSVGTLEFRRNFIRMFEARGLEIPRSMIESDSLDVTKASLLRTDFLTLLPRQAIAAEERAGLLALVPFDSPAWSREVAVVYRRRGVRFGLLETLLEELRRAARHVRPAGA
jgi:LysR family transcriptional regulator of gallate degradation